jgi:HEAT repeat protein
VTSSSLVASRSDSARPDIAALTAADDRPALRRALGHAEAAIRARAADSLARLGDDRSVALLRQSLRSDGDDHVREEAAVALGRLKGTGAVNDLIIALKTDRSPHVREEAAVALGRIGDERAIGSLREAADDRFTMVRRAVAEAIEALRA